MHFSFDKLHQTTLSEPAVAGNMAPQASQLRVLGVGAGMTCVLHKECSSSFVLELDGSPLLMVDAVSGRQDQLDQCAAQQMTGPLCSSAWYMLLNTTKTRPFGSCPTHNRGLPLRVWSQHRPHLTECACYVGAGLWSSACCLAALWCPAPLDLHIPQSL